MMKNNFSFILCLLLSINIYSQEKNNIIKGDDLRKVFFSEYNFENQFDINDFENFNIKSFNSEGIEIPLCINSNLEIYIDCNIETPYAQIINSIIYDMDMNKIGYSFLGTSEEKIINNFWAGFDYWKGNISIYDMSGTYRLATFMYFEPEKDYYSIMEVDSTVTFKQLKKNYKKLIKKYNLKKYPDDEEIQQKNIEINEAFIALSRDLNPDFEEEDENWIINFFKKDRRSNWSDEEGYVPYTKRNREESTPETQKSKDKYPYIED